MQWQLLATLIPVAVVAVRPHASCEDGVTPAPPNALLQSLSKKSSVVNAEEGSCAEYGCIQYTRQHSCQCNSRCSHYGNCCSDYTSQCVPTPAPTPAPASCATYGCIGYTPSHECQCNALCARYQNCCGDYSEQCVPVPTPVPTPVPSPEPTPPPASCAVFGCIGYKPSNPCQCNNLCSRYSNCCGDYVSACTSSSSTSTQTPTSSSPPSTTSPAPAPSVNSNLSYTFWLGVDMSSQEAVEQKLADTHQRMSYRQLWEAFKTVWVDLPGVPVSCAGKIFEVYSDKCWSPGAEQCGQYRDEGDCYNREHSWPKSWWGGKKNDAYSDLFHVYPSDGYVNSKRSSFPFGTVESPTYTSSDGSKLGPCSSPGATGGCFEPSGKHKGNLARGHFYVATRYKGDFSCCTQEGVQGAEIRPWLRALLLQWHQDDPVEPWEQEFNNRVQALQGNRNPFIDFPDLAQAYFS